MAARFNFQRWSLLLTLIASLSTLVYCVSVGTTVESGLQAAKTGVVLDAQTGQPLTEVYVVARWLEQSTRPALLGRGGTVEGQCLYRVVVRTDSQGKYLIPETRTKFKVASNPLDRSKRYFWDLYTYSSGYDGAADGRAQPAIRSLSADKTQTLQPIMLAAEHAAAGQRVSALADTLSRFTCEPYSTDPLPIAQQVYAEAYATACLPEPNAAASALARLRRGMTPVSTADAAEPCLQFRQANNQTQ